MDRDMKEYYEIKRKAQTKRDFGKEKREKENKKEKN